MSDSQRRPIPLFRRTLALICFAPLLLWASLWAAAQAAWWLVAPGLVAPETPLEGGGPAFALGLVVVFAPLLVLAVRIVGRGSPGPAWSYVVGAAGITLPVAAAFEFAIDHAWVLVTGEPAWRYLVAPTHGGYTSAVGLVMWPMYGAFVAALHHAVAGRPRLAILHSPWGRAALLAVEALALEIAANLYALLAFGCFFFYYLPNDLLHFTTIRIALPYLVAGRVGVAALDALERHPQRLGIGLAAWVIGAAFVVSS
jgi:hypothetical protein